ncbi:3-oxoadipate CoA-transferase subunit A [Candidatus Syntrophocurvum alkaliphilum]|uniref:3-oxoadipate CoA-transferase subunit A n=1 Tax=Candidatus Syntrophocurvum alkaliphilum TaxID=2293317 RepID=A0A6I6DCZ4_9FIRM|nr:CoA transferase [Candidatus Syntrophocurvum alkaliphilum]QGU00080.1 3-oxoadipate CoA-transferase subunit A [Candidatus Syntrophocurvum alkaliphilum]
MAKVQKVSIQEAVSQIKDGDMLTFSGFTIWRRPMAAIYEMIRQGKKDLHLVEVNGGTHSDLLIGAGCVKIWESCWIGHELFGKIGGNLSRKAENGEVVIEDYSHVQILYRMAAGALGIPYMPTYASLGTDMLNPEYDHLGKLGLRDGSNPKIPKKKYEIAKDPFYGSELVHIPACNPDWCIAFVQMVGEEGTVRVEGQLYSDEEAIKASDNVIIVAEQVVTEDYIRREPSKNLIAPHQIDYIVELPWGAHPTGCFGCYETDGAFLSNFFSSTRTQEGLDAWVDEWVFGVKDFNEYLSKVGFERLETIRANPALGYSTKVKRGKR